MTEQDFQKALEAQQTLIDIKAGIWGDLLLYKKEIALFSRYFFIEDIEFYNNGNIEVFCNSDDDGSNSFLVPKEYLFSDNKAEWIQKILDEREAIHKKQLEAQELADKPRKEAFELAEYKRLAEKFKNNPAAA